MDIGTKSHEQVAREIAFTYSRCLDTDQRWILQREIAEAMDAAAERAHQQAAKKPKKEDHR